MIKKAATGSKAAKASQPAAGATKEVKMHQDKIEALTKAADAAKLRYHNMVIRNTATKSQIENARWSMVKADLALDMARKRAAQQLHRYAVSITVTNPASHSGPSSIATMYYDLEAEGASDAVATALRKWGPMPWATPSGLSVSVTKVS